MKDQAFEDKIRGPYQPLCTPCHADGNIEEAIVGMLVRRQVDSGFHYGNGVVMVMGAAGEFERFTTDKRKLVAERAIEAANNDIGVVVGVQAHNHDEMIDLAQHAARHGAVAIQVAPIAYFRPSADETYDIFKRVSENADIPIIAYTTYWKTRDDAFGWRNLERIVGLDNVKALKLCLPDFTGFQSAMADFASEVSIFDNTIYEIESHVRGAVGVNWHMAVIKPDWAVKTWNHLENQEYEEAQKQIDTARVPYYRLAAEVGEVSESEAVLDKALLNMLGLQVGNPRLPARPLPENLIRRAREFLLNIGYEAGELCSSAT